MNILTDIGIIITCASFALAWVNNLFISFSYGKLCNFIKKKKKSNSNTAQPICKSIPISVVITAYNQGESLRNNLPKILQQNYPNFEVIVVNNNSNDDTEQVLNVLEQQYPNLYHTFTPSSARYISQKRLALMLGFRAAKHDLVVLIEADCYPESSNWLSNISSACTPETQIVLGYSNYETQNSIVKAQPVFFRLYDQMQYLSWALQHPAYRASGTNMAYRKSLFLQHKGFAGHVNLINGAEELLVNHHSTRKNTAVVIGSNCATRQQKSVSSKSSKQELTFYMETRRYFKNKYLYRCIMNWKMFSPWFFCFTYFMGTSFSILSSQWIITALLSVFFIQGIIIKVYYFNRTAIALGERPYYLSFIFNELGLLPRNMIALIRHRFTHKSYFQRKVV